MNLEKFRRVVKRYTTLALQIYDRLGGNEQDLLRTLAYFHDNRRLRENPVRLQQLFFDAEVYDWRTGPVTQSQLDRVEWTVPMQGWAAALPYDEIDIDRPGVQVRVEDLVRRLPEAFMRKRIDLIASIFDSNPVAYDGQDFFSGAHPHPLGKGTFSNDFTFDLSAPTDAAVYEFVHELHRRFLDSLHLNQTWVEVSDVGNLLIVVPTSELASAFQRVRTEDRLDKATGEGTFKNNLMGKFRLIHARKGQSADKVFGIWDDPAGPKPTVLVLDRDPWLDTDTSSRFAYSRLAVVMKSIFAAKALYPHAAQRATVTSGPVRT